VRRVTSLARDLARRTGGCRCVRRCGSGVVGPVSSGHGRGPAKCLVHGGKVVRQHVQRRAELAAHPRALRRRARKHSPDESHQTAPRHDGDAVQCEPVRQVPLLPGRLRGRDAHHARLQLVANNEHLRDDRNQARGQEARVLEDEVVVREQAQLQQH
jgi:hypothetical protein